MSIFRNPDKVASFASKPRQDIFGKYIDVTNNEHKKTIQANNEKTWKIQEAEPYVGPGIYEEMTPEFDKKCWDTPIANNLKRKAEEEVTEEESSESDPPSHLDGVFRELSEAWIAQNGTLILQSMLDQELKKQRSKSSARNTLKNASDSISKK